MSDGIQFRSLAFHGPSRDASFVQFGPGLNVIWGTSEAGKSFILDTVDFMLGGKGPLRDIPERVGYDRILLACETLSGEQFTLSRSTEGGAFRIYEGRHAGQLPDGDGRIVSDLHSEKNDDNLSSFLLSKIGLSHRRLRRNKRGDTQSLSFRNLARLLIVNEEEIIQQRSPLSDGNYAADTANTSVFKLLLTGVDDSALATAQARSPEAQTRGAQLDLLDQLIKDYQKQVKELAGPRDELEDQLERLEGTMEEQSEDLSLSETEFKRFTVARRDVARRLEEGRNRLAEVTALLERFTLLGAHYRSDVERLKAIEEAGSLFVALGTSRCPLCGAAPEHHDHSVECDGDIDQVVAGARREIEKIELRQEELNETIDSLRSEAANFERRLPKLEENLSSVSGEIDRVIAPNLQNLRSSYRKLADKGGEVREALAIHRGLKDLEDRKAELEKEDEASGGAGNVNDVDLSASAADKFAAIVLDVLTAWHFPKIERVHFDLKLRDLVINGKNRTSYGKGLRAVTQTAFTISLLEYCKRSDTPHPGFVVLDSPLLSYKAPEGSDDDLRGTDLIDRFYEFLTELKSDRQIIIIENTAPPASIRDLPQTIEFTGRPDFGRAGLFR
jgi:uncharacterized protein YlxW (UPF0749 family)